MEILMARSAGHCSGVKKALDKAEELFHARGKSSPPGIYTLGPIIHNRIEVERLQKRFGVTPVDRLEEIPRGSILLIRSHGEEPKTFERAAAQGLEVVDTTCRHVREAQQAAQKLVNDGYRTLIVGHPQHPEVRGILGHTGGRAEVIDPDRPFTPEGILERVGVVPQTTLEEEKLNVVVRRLMGACVHLHVVNAICSATLRRQREVERLAHRVEVMVIVGGRESANTAHLADICRRSGTAAHQVESVGELDPSWFSDVRHAGLAGGASTSRRVMKEVELWFRNQFPEGDFR